MGAIASSVQPGLLDAAVVVGLRAEARLARRLGTSVYIGGGTANGAAVASRRAVALGAPALISLGLAGGLDPSLRPGDVIVPEAVVVGGRVVRADPALGRVLGGLTPIRILGAEAIVADVREKRRLRDATGAAAVDLESGAVASLATEEGLPFAVLRVVCDPAERALPPAALVALNHQGAIGLFPVLASALAQPAQFRALLKLAGDTDTARRALAGRIALIVASA